MVKKAKAPASKAVGVPDEARAKAASLRADGDKLFTARAYARALDAYGAAAKALPPGAAERADLHCNKAACLYALKKYKDATRECSSALAVAPTSTKALVRRARSLEQQQLFKAALSDMQAVNRSAAATEETREAEQRLRDIVAGRRPPPPAAGATPPPGAAGRGDAAAAAAARQRAAAAAAAAAAQRHEQQQQQRPTHVAARVTLGGETKALHLPLDATTYASLLDAARDKFPGAGPIRLQYVDPDGDTITLASRLEVRAAMSDAVRGAPAPKGGLPPMAPSLKIAALPCAEGEAPPVPEDEAAELEAMKRYQEIRVVGMKRDAELRAALEGSGDDAAAGDAIEVDDFLVDAGALVQGRLGGAGGGDYNAQVRELDVLLRSPDAAPLLGAAAERFCEITCQGIINGANVHLCRAHRLLDRAALAGGDLGDAEAAEAVAHLDRAEAAAKEVSAYQEGHPDALTTLASIAHDRAKLAARLVVAPVPPPPAGAPAEEVDAYNAATVQTLHAALKKVKAAGLEEARAHMAACEELHKQALAAAAAADARREADRAARAAARGSAAGGGAAGKASTSGERKAGAPVPATLAAGVGITRGNALFDWSQMLASAGDAGWRAALEEAKAAYREADCTDEDIRAALKNHIAADQLELGPDPEPAAGGGGGGGAGAADAPQQAKGLPALGGKKK